MKQKRPDRRDRHDSDRRAFLVRAAAVAGAGLAQDAYAQKPEQREQATGHHEMSAAEHGGAFFNQHNAATIAAFTERLMPGAPGKPGAREAEVLNYIDLALAGAYADLQDFYRRGLAQLDAYCQTTYQETFLRLTAAQQDEVISALEESRATGFAWPAAQEFFNTVRTHTMEGMFADPIYGGNKDFAGWRLVGFPGGQAIFTPSDMHSAKAFTRAPMIGLEARAKGRA